MDNDEHFESARPNGWLNISRTQWAVGILDIPRTDIESDEIAVASTDISEIMAKKDLLDLEEAWTQAKKEINEVYADNELIRNIGYRVIVQFLKPNVIFDRELTERRQDTATSRFCSDCYAEKVSWTAAIRWIHSKKSCC